MWKCHYSFIYWLDDQSACLLINILKFCTNEIPAYRFPIIFREITQLSDKTDTQPATGVSKGSDAEKWTNTYGDKKTQNNIFVNRILVISVPPRSFPRPRTFASPRPRPTVHAIRIINLLVSVSQLFGRLEMNRFFAPRRHFWNLVAHRQIINKCFCSNTGL